MTFFNWWNFALCAGLVFGVTLIVYVQDHVNWGVSDIVLTVVMVVSLVIFIIGRPSYRYRAVTGSPLTPLFQVFVAAIRKRNLPYPSNPSQLYEIPKLEKTRGRLLCQTKKLKYAFGSLFSVLIKCNFLTNSMHDEKVIYVRIWLNLPYNW